MFIYFIIIIELETTIEYVLYIFDIYCFTTALRFTCRHLLLLLLFS